MPEVTIPLIKGDKIRLETDYGDSLPINMYPVRKDILGAKGYMLGMPGLVKFGDTFGPDRAGIYNERFEEHYRLSGNRFGRVNADGTFTALGTVSGSEQASLPYSFNSQAIIADGKMFLYDSAAGFRQVTDPDLGNPIDSVWVDGLYFLTDGEFIYHTDITDESSVDPLKYATAEFMPDKSLAVAKTPDNKVLVFGRYSLEYFVNTASENFSFTRVETRAQKIGIVATHAKCEADGKWFITGGRKEEGIGVYGLTVGSVSKISTREVDKILAQYTEPELFDMRMEARLENDSYFIYVHLPNEVLCYSLDIAQEFGNAVAWFKLRSGKIRYSAVNGVFDSNLGKWLYGDKVASTVAKLDPTLFSQYGEEQQMYLDSPFIKLNGMSIDELEIETIPGYNVAEDATVAISLTYDGVAYGKEWWNLYGNFGDRSTRFTIRRLGDVQDWVGFRFRTVTKSRLSFAGLKVTYG